MTDTRTRRRPFPRSPAARAACLLFLAGSVTLTAFGRGERSGWTLMTSPTGYDHRTNTLIGYSWLRAGEPYMKENIPCVSQVGLFAGSREALSAAEYRDDFRLIRGVYSFAASLIAPAVGILPALLAVNWLSWAVCAAAAFDLARRLAGSPVAGLLAVALVTFGIGPIVHIGDDSPHVLAFATYFAGIWLLVRTGVHERRLPLRTHLAIGFYLAVCCLAYNTGVMLLAAYGLVAATRNRWAHLAAAAAIALSARPLWQAVLGPSVVDVEADYLSVSLAKWSEVLRSGPTLAAKTALHFAAEIVFSFESPGVLLAGLAACLLTPMPPALRRLGLAAVGMPWLAAFVFAPSATARGYLVYAGSVWVYASLAAGLATMLRSPGTPAKAVAVAAVIVLPCSQLLWSTAHFKNHLGPVKTYFLGWDDGLPYFAPPTEIVSLTGREPTPILFGGNASLPEAGSVVTPPDRLLQSPPSFGLAVLSRGFFVAYLLALAWLAAPTRKRRIAAASTLAGGFLISSALAPLTIRSVPAFFPVDRAVTLPPGGTLAYEATLGADRLRRLATPDPDATIGVFFRLYAPAAVEVSLSADGENLPVFRDPDPDYNSFFRLRDPARDAPRLANARRLAWEVRNPTPDPVMLAGWQRPDLPSRLLRITAADGSLAEPPLALPAFELRVADPRGHLTFAAF